MKITYPILYKRDETNFSHLGLGILSDCLECTVTEEKNGIYILEMKYRVTGVLSEYLKEENIIKAQASYKWKDQRFIIKSVKESNSYIKVYAEHERYKINDNQMRPQNGVTNRNAQTALEQWKAYLIDKNNFEVMSDIKTLNSAYWDIDGYDNAKEVLSGREGSILDIWGGEYEFDNNRIYLWQNRGQELYTPVAYGRNIVDREQERNIEDTYTTIYPYAKYQKKDKNNNVIANQYDIVTVSGYYIDCDNASDFMTRKIQKVDFSQEVLEEDSDGNPLPLTVAQLTHLAKDYLKNNNFGVPKINITVDFIDLAKNNVNEGESLQQEKYNLCDLVPVWLVKQNVQVKAKVIMTEWNVLTSSYNKIELGEAKDDLRVVFNKMAYTQVNQAVQKSKDEIIQQTNNVAIHLNANLEENLKEVTSDLDKRIAVNKDNIKVNEDDLDDLSTATTQSISVLIDEDINVNKKIDDVNTNTTNNATEINSFKAVTAENFTAVNETITDLESDIDNKANIDDLNNLVGITEGIDADLKNKATIAALTELLNEYDARNIQIEKDKELTENALKTLQDRADGLTLQLGETKAIFDFVNTVIHQGEEGIEIMDKVSNIGMILRPGSSNGTQARLSFMDGGVETAVITGQLLKINRGIFVNSLTVDGFKDEVIVNSNGDKVLVTQYVG